MPLLANTEATMWSLKH